MATSRSSSDVPLAPLDTLALRAMMKEMTAIGIKALGPLPKNVEEFWITITLPDGWKSRSLVIRPKILAHGSKISMQKSKHPLIVYFYGGGFTASGPEQCTQPARDFADKFGAVVVCPDYRLVPEFRWPVPMRDGYDVLEYLAENAASELGATLDGPDGGFIVGGASAGGSIAAVAGAIAMFGDGTSNIKELAKPLTGLCLCIPWLLTEEIVPEEFKPLWTSRKDNEKGKSFNSSMVKQINEALQPDVHSPWFSPCNAIRSGAKDCKKVQPPVYLQACQLDPLRDDAIVFERMLASRGIRTKLDLFPNDGHASYTALPSQTASRNPTLKEGLLLGMEWLLQGHTGIITGRLTDRAMI
jgi:acetyl esterase/lipase